MPNTTTAQPCSAAPSPAAMKEACIAYARRTVLAKVDGSTYRLDRVDEMPQLALTEVRIGKLLGKGGFCTVHEVKGWDNNTQTTTNNSHIERRHSFLQGSGSAPLFKTLRMKKSNNNHHDDHENKEAARQGESHGMPSSTGDGCCYAIKKLRADVVGQSDAGQFLQGIMDMAMETRFLSHLEHPNIVKLHAIATGGDCFSPDYFLIIDRLYDTLDHRIHTWANRRSRGSLLRRMSDRKGTKAAALYEERIKAAHDIAAALAYLHEKNIVYRDLKPDNIGFDVAGDIKLFDFGLARELSPYARRPDGTYQLTENTGSLVYMAPEVVEKGRYNFSCDAYSFAIVFWEMLALRPAFAGYTPRLFREKVHQAPYKRPTLFDGSEQDHHNHHHHHQDIAEDDFRSSAMRTLMRNSWSHQWQERFRMKEIREQLRAECGRMQSGHDENESELEHFQRRSTFDLPITDEPSPAWRNVPSLSSSLVPLEAA